MFMARSRSRVLRGSSPSLRNVDDPALLHPQVVDGHPWPPGQLVAQQRRQRLHTGLDGLGPEGHGVAHRHAQSDLAGHVPLPVLESAGVRAERVGVGIDPVGGLQVDEGRIEGPDDVAPHVEEARAPRRYLRPVAESMWQPMRSTSTASWPTDWQASSK